MKEIIVLLSLTIASYSFAGVKVIGNGGDAVAQEFTSYAQSTATFLPLLNTTILSKPQIQRFQSLVSEAKVVTKTHLFLKNIEVDAINYPSDKLIEVSLSRWNSLNEFDVKSKRLLALHEYLWLTDIDDTNYRISIPLYNEIRNYNLGFPYYLCASHIKLFNKNSEMIWEDTQKTEVGYQGTQGTGAQILTHNSPFGQITTAVQVSLGTDGNGNKIQSADFFDVKNIFGNFYDSSRFEAIEEPLPKKFSILLKNRKITEDAEVTFQLMCQSLL